LGLGFSVYRKWRPPTAAWVWVPGVLWFASRLLLTLDGKHGTFWELVGSASYADDASVANWTEVTLPLIRTVFYSVGALCYPGQ
jgi:hypothetical protein